MSNFSASVSLPAPMKLSDFDYELPKELIAQNALPKRSDARLLILNRMQESIEHKTFWDIADYFEQGDVLVLNDTKVLPARLFAKRKTGGRVEILVLGATVPGTAGTGFALNSSNLSRNVPGTAVLIKPSGRIRKGEELVLLGDSHFTVRVLDEANHDTGIRRVEFQTKESVASILNRIGRIPLPPYIDREDLPLDRELYQTVFAKRPGAVASPTAGLHFDEALLRKLEAKGVEILFVTLHVSYGTFQPVVNEDLSRHQMYEEYFEVPEETAERINFAKSDGRRIIACGTTVVRTLESVVGLSTVPGTAGTGFALNSSNLSRNVPGTVNAIATRGSTQLFIYPPYEFKIADAMITNFHLPKTTLLMLTSTFAGHEFLMRAYREAIEHKYRFYSYGDAMLVV